MNIIFQVALLGLVFLSFVMVIGVPVAYASPQNWIESKKFLWIGSIAWTILVITVGILNFFVV